MQISIKDTNSASLYPKIAEIGYNGVDINFPLYNYREKILSDDFDKLIRKKFENLSNYGMSVSQTHLSYYPGHLEPLGNGTYKYFEEYMLPVLVKEIEITAKMNCNVAVIHLFFCKNRDMSRNSNIELISKLLPILEKNNVTLSIENIFGSNCCDVHLTTAKDLLFYTEYFRSENLGICLDTGHAIALNQNPTEMLRTMNNNVKALHLHSNIPGYDLHLPPNFTNSHIDWNEFYLSLKNTTYPGMFNIETRAPISTDIETVKSYYSMVYGLAKSIVSIN